MFRCLIYTGCVGSRYCTDVILLHGLWWYYTTQNTEHSPNFLVWKLCLSTKFPHQEIKWKFGILHSGREVLIWLDLFHRGSKLFHHIIIITIPIYIFMWQISFITYVNVMNLISPYSLQTFKCFVFARKST